VTVLVDTLKSVVTIPAVAVRHGPQGDFVYVIQDDSTVTVTPVKVGPAQGETASIVSGLNVGDQVVTDGGDRLSDGSRVVLPKDAARMAAAFNRKPKAAGIFGWIEGLFGHTDQTAAGGAGGQGGQAGQGGGGGRGGAGRMQAMLAGLNLTADQQAKVTAIFADARTKVAAAGDDSDARRTIMQNANQQVEALLTPDQKAKFDAARAKARAAGGFGGAGGASPSAAPPAAQSASPAAVSPVLSGPRARRAQAQADSSQAPASPPANGAGSSGGRGHFLDALGLNPAQQIQAQAIMAQARASQDPDARRAAMAKLQAILTPAQKAKLAAMRAARGGGGGGGNQ
jgi:Spy/CpxP family protein refolding chaperone